MQKRPGKRERDARKRHRRGLVWSSNMPAVSGPLKLGSKHLRRHLHAFLSVADTRNNRGKSPRSPGGSDSPQGPATKLMLE